MAGFWESLSSWVWVFIPLIAIGSGAFITVAKLRVEEAKNKQASSPDLTRAVESIKAELKTQQQSLERRVANLETIVTSQTWDVLHDSKLNSEEKKLLTQSFRSEIEELKDGLSDTRKVELLIGRLK
jgi:phosphoenolpyruvate-protein kinase (PTS system EI component)